MYKSDSVYRVRHNRNYLRHICEELIYGIKLGRNNIVFKKEGLEELKKYKEYSFQRGLDIPNEKRTNLELSLEWIVILFIDFIENKGTGDLTPPLSLAEKTIIESKDLQLFRWQEMKDSETVYIKRKNSFLSSSNSKVKFKYKL